MVFFCVVITGGAKGNLIGFEKQKPGLWSSMNINDAPIIKNSSNKYYTFSFW